MKKEIQLMELKEKVSEAKKKKDEQENYLIGVVFASLFFFGVSIFVYFKKQEIPEKYREWAFYGCVGMTVIGIIMSIFGYNWYTKANKELKELKKQEKELKESAI